MVNDSLFEGKLCPDCGTWKRLDEFNLDRRCSDQRQRRCRSCCSRYNREYYQANKEKYIARAIQWAQNHPERRNQIKRAWRQRNPLASNLQTRRWRRANLQHHRDTNRAWYWRTRPARLACVHRRRLANPILFLSYQNKRRSQQSANGGHFTQHQWHALCARYHHRCIACGQHRPLTADHVVPVCLGGSSDISNIQPLCRSCNSSKGKRIIDFRFDRDF